MPRRQRDQRKREWDHDDDGEGTVDDLAHAATFAMMTMIPNPTGVLSDVEKLNIVNSQETENEQNDDDDEAIEIDTFTDGEESISPQHAPAVACDDDDDNDDDDDDDQSDIDLTNELAKMDDDENLDDDEEEEGGTSTCNKNIPRPPKTENEMDAYRTPIQELEKHLQFRLTVTPEESGTTVKNSRLTSSNLQLAGRIKHYMAFDRTVVVESAVVNPHGDSSSFKHENAPLDEGTLLLLRPPHDLGGNSKENDELLIPLGRIFEVFGPVSQPLYTIRLPTITMKANNSKSSDTKIGKQNDTPATEDHAKASDHQFNTDNAESQLQTTTMTPVAETTDGDSADKTPTIFVEGETNADLSSIELKGGECTSPSEKLNAKITAPKQGVIAQQETSVTSMDEEDHWGSDGKYARMLQQNAQLSVYYVKDEARVIDTGFILKNSRKGCDASNLYDEEVINASEMYYSDDEEERQAKNRRKSKGSNQTSTTTPQQPNTNSDWNSLPSGFHHAAPSSSNQRFAHPSSSAAALPQGFHQPPPPHTLASRGPYGFHMTSHHVLPLVGRGPPPPPPPPPSGGVQPPPAYQY